MTQHQAAYEQGERLYKQGRYEEAATLFESIILINSEDSDAHYRAGICYGLSGNYRRANSRLFRAKSLGKPAPPIDRQLGANYFYMHQSDSGLHYLDSAQHYVGLALVATPADKKAQLLANMIEATPRR